MATKEKRAILAALSSGRCQVAIGTHALLEENVIFKKLGLVITDEQHRFGVRQRTQLMTKKDRERDRSCMPDSLVMTATPIPRTLALILYGDLDISIIDDDGSHSLNPNTVDKTVYLLIIGLIAIVFITIGHIINVRRYNKI